MINKGAAPQGAAFLCVGCAPNLSTIAAAGTERSGVTHVVPCGPKGERSE